VLSSPIPGLFSLPGGFVENFGGVAVARVEVETGDEEVMVLVSEGGGLIGIISDSDGSGLIGITPDSDGSGLIGIMPVSKGKGLIDIIVTEDVSDGTTVSVES
jgi:hypothetical protein